MVDFEGPLVRTTVWVPLSWLELMDALPVSRQETFREALAEKLGVPYRTKPPPEPDS